MSTPKRLIQTEFDVELFTELLTGTIASRVAYARARLCPCRAERTGPDPRCTVCNGRGYRYDEPVLVRAGVTGVRHRRDFTDRGVVDDADAAITVARYMDDHATPNPAWDAGEGDRFELVDVKRRESQHLQRRGPSDRLKYRNASQVTLESIRDGAIHTWREGIDYTLDAGTITWTPGHGPAQGEHYAASMQANPRYHVFRELPQLRHIDGKNLPRRFGLKLGEWAPGA